MSFQRLHDDENMFVGKQQIMNFILGPPKTIVSLHLRDEFSDDCESDKDSEFTAILTREELQVSQS